MIALGMMMVWLGEILRMGWRGGKMVGVVVVGHSVVEKAIVETPIVHCSQIEKSR